MRYSDFHLHTNYCDGRDDIESIIREAIKKDMKMLGFSGHSYIDFDDCCMTPEGQVEYCKTIEQMKQKYHGDIHHDAGLNHTANPMGAHKDENHHNALKIFCGVELDYYSEISTEPFDYVIGSVHFCKTPDGYACVDNTAAIFMENVEKYFNGNCFDFAEAYYENIKDVKRKTGCDIVGHFDLITKFNEGGVLFDESAPRYRDMAIAALDELIAQDALFEVNTGALSRKYKTTPYPSEFLLKRILEKNGRVILSSDAHAKENLCYKFPEMMAYLESLGFTAANFGCPVH